MPDFIPRLWRPTVAIVCAAEALAIAGCDLGVPGLRRLPTVTSLCAGHRWRAAAVLAVLAVHLATATT